MTKSLYRTSQNISGYTMEASTEAKVINALSECIRTDKPAALVTVVATTGSAPGKPSALMVVLGDGSTIGTVGGGSLEHKITTEAVQCIGLGKSKEVSYDLQADAELGMSCGGSVRAFIRVFKASPQLIIIGAGHIGLELYKIGRIQGFQVVVFDDRPELASEERFPDAKRIVADDLATSLKKYAIHTDCYVTIATSSHETDRLVLEAVVESEASYIGMIGSSNKIRKIFEYLLAQEIAREKIEQVFAPMGLNIASIRPAEIAVSIIGEILLVKNNGSPEHMRAVKKNVLPL
jgi:xanthine dehydrogenase accessory factor